MKRTEEREKNKDSRRRSRCERKSQNSRATPNAATMMGK